MPLYLDQLETPAAVVDLDRLALNLDRMAAYCAVHGLRLRPHVKTHKAPRIAAEQLRLGAAGLTVATVREAEVMSELTDDLLLAYPLAQTTALRRFTNIAPSVRLAVSLDSRAAAGPATPVRRIPTSTSTSTCTARPISPAAAASRPAASRESSATVRRTLGAMLVNRRSAVVPTSG